MTITKKCRAFPARLRLAAGIYISKPLEGGRTKQRECPAERTTGLQRDLDNGSIDRWISSGSSRRLCFVCDGAGGKILFRAPRRGWFNIANSITPGQSSSTSSTTKEPFRLIHHRTPLLSTEVPGLAHLGSLLPLSICLGIPVSHCSLVPGHHGVLHNGFSIARIGSLVAPRALFRITQIHVAACACAGIF